MTTSVRAGVRIVTSHSYIWKASFDDYDGAPDAGHQCIGHSDPTYDNTEDAAIKDLYRDWEDWFEQPLCAHRPMIHDDLVTGEWDLLEMWMENGQFKSSFIP